MVATPNYGWVMPDPTDFVTNLPADFEIFGDAVDASVKALNPGTTAGDIDYYTSSTAKTRIGIGSAGQVLTVNTGGTAPQWAALPASGAAPHLVRTGVNNYVRSHATCAIVDPGGASASNTVQYTPIYLPSSTINRIGVRSAPTGSYAATTYRLGLYTSGTNAEPSTLVIDAGTVNVNASNSNFEITISQGVTPGWHYLAVVNQNAGTWRLDSVSDVTQSLIFSNTTMATGVAKLLGFTQGSVSGALPATATPVASTSTIPVAWVRVA